MAALSLVLLFSPQQPGEPPFQDADKVVHYLLFAALAGTARWRFGPRGRVLWAVFAYAAASELVQGALLPGRSGDVVDLLADAAGAALGWLLARRRLRA